MIGIAFGIGFAFGPALGGLLSHFDPRLAFWVAGGLSLANWAWGFFFVPESLALAKRKGFELRRANPIGSLRILRSHREIWQVNIIQLIAYTAHNVFSVWVLYTIYCYNWGEISNGLSLMAVGIVTAIISGTLPARMVKRWGEKKTLYIGQFFGAVGMVVAGLARTGFWLFASIPIISLWNISMPAAQSIATRRVSEQEQGELQGAIQSMRSITFIIGPVLFLQTFRWFIDPKHGRPVPGAPFFLGGALLFAAALLATRLKIADATTISPPSSPAEPETMPGAVPSGVDEPPTM